LSAEPKPFINIMSRAVNVCWMIAVKGSLHWWTTDGTDEHHVKGTIIFEALVNPLAGQCIAIQA
jgi:hypothetical protein